MIGAEIRAFCEQNAASILVRSRVGGEWGAHPLSKLTEDEREHCIVTWIDLGHCPRASAKEPGVSEP